MTNLYIVMAANGLFKIGKSDNLRNRIAQIQAASPIECELFWSTEYDDDIQDLENILHDRFSDKRVRGEWFALDKNDLVDLISGDDEYKDLIEKMFSWGFFRLGEKELLEKPMLIILGRTQALCESRRYL